MAKKKKVGVLEYRDEKYIKEVMKIVKKNTDSNVDFFGLGQHEFKKPGEFDVIFDMISPFNKYISEIMKVYYLNGAYIINNPFVVTTYNKIIQTYKLMEMNMPFPRTVVLPNESDETETGFVDKPYFKSILKTFKFPFVMKPFDGFANVDVFAIKSRKDLYRTYKEKKNRIMLIQEAIHPVDYYRVFVVNKKHVHFLKRQPRFIEAKNYDFYDFSMLTPGIRRDIIQNSLKINREMGYDLTTIEWSITKDGEAYVIDVNDAPNIADPKKAKRMDLHFPEETYNWLIDKISKMIIEKVEMDPYERHLEMKKAFTSTMYEFIAGIKHKLKKPLRLYL